jgi:hypothetical protein
MNKTMLLNVKGALLTAGSNVTVSVNGNKFSTTATTLSAVDLMSDAGVNMEVVFTPAAVGLFTGTLSFASADFSAPKTLNLSGEGVNVTTVATLAELRDLAPNITTGEQLSEGTFVYTGEALITHKLSFKNQKYIQDATGAILIFDADNIVTSNLEVGDVVSNITCKLASYYGMKQIQPTNNFIAVGWNQTVDPLVTPLSSLDRDVQNPLQAKLIRLENVTFTSTGTFAPQTTKYYNLAQNGINVDSILYVDDYNYPYVGQNIPAIAMNINGVINFEHGVNRIIPLVDFLTAVEDFNVAQIQLSPNPATSYIRLTMGSDMHLEIHSITGQYISSETLSAGTHIISLQTLPSGLYILKMTDIHSKKVYTNKLLVE